MDEFMTRLFANGFPIWPILGIIFGIFLIWLLTAVIFGEKPAWKYKDQEKAMKALDKLEWWNYPQLLEAEQKSPLPEVSAAARTKNRLGLGIKNALRRESGQDFDPDGEDRQIEYGTLAVCRNGKLLPSLTSSLPEDVVPKKAENAEYVLDLVYDNDQTGSYTDGSGAYRSVVTGTLKRDGLQVWQRKMYGGDPPAQKTWGSQSRSERADGTMLVLIAIQTVQG